MARVVWQKQAGEGTNCHQPNVHKESPPPPPPCMSVCLFTVQQTKTKQSCQSSKFRPQGWHNRQAVKKNNNYVQKNGKAHKGKAHNGGGKEGTGVKNNEEKQKAREGKACTKI